ncbi:hypothetical protein Leryth_027021 [Lithospermum erythrorhizon]|nr:hypothetical protein Leryth_027021 [Lithospermum erythrorhizon]
MYTPYVSIFIFLILFIFSSSSSTACLATRLPPTKSTAAKFAISNNLKNHSHPWFQFKRFVDARRGSQVDGISELKKYFHKFGYIKKIDILNDTFDGQLEQALAKYQEKLGLHVTRKLDSETISEIMSPRCGFSDTFDKLHATKRYTYFTGKPRWSRDIPMTLTYGFSPIYKITSLGMNEIQGAFRRAFNHWASVIQVNFIQTEDYDFADIKIGFYLGAHGDDEPFDGVLGVLAHAFSPENGQFHLDAAETWAYFKFETAQISNNVTSIGTFIIVI